MDGGKHERAAWSGVVIVAPTASFYRPFEEG